MAEDTDSKKNPNPPVSFNRGLFTDLAPENQPAGTYRFALNAVLESQQGDFNAISNEQSNTDCVEFPVDFVPIGSIYMANDERVVMLVNRDESISKIGVVKNCEYVEYIEDPGLGFKLTKPIKGLFRVRNGCERNIYFYDGFNYDRAINLDRLEIYKDANGNWVTNEFTLIRQEADPTIEFAQYFNDGGSTKVGRFQVAVRYLDEYNNTAPATQFTEPYNVILGDYTIGNTVNDYNAALGIDGGLLSDNRPSNKSFLFNITNLNPEYPYLEVIILETTNGTTSAYVVNKISINGQTSLEYLYTGVGTSYSYPIEINSVTNKGVKELTSKGMTQVEGRLIRANTSEPFMDWTPFVKAALKTQAYYTINAETVYDPVSYNTKYPAAATSFMADEVYAFGIRWIIDDVIESPVFHIPGRRPINDSSLRALGNSNNHNRQICPSNNWDKQILVVDQNDIDYGPNTDPTTLNATESRFLKNTYLKNNPNVPFVERWQMFNTAIRTGTVSDSLQGDLNPSVFQDSGILAYHESATEIYPNVKDCNGDPLYSYRDSQNVLVDFSGQPVRHHKMPDRTLEPQNTEESLANIKDVLARNIQPLFEVEFPINIDRKRLKYQIVVVDRDKTNSTVIDAGIIALAPFTKRNVSDPIGRFRAVTTNYNFTMSNLNRPTKWPFSWYYTHFVSPSFTHKEEYAGDAYYKLDRVMYGSIRRYFGVKDSSSAVRFTSRFFATKSVVPGTAFTSGSPAGDFKVPTENLNSTPNWYYRTIRNSGQIAFNDHRIMDGMTSVATDGAMTAYPSLPEEINSFGSLIDQRVQKGTICSHEPNQRIPDYFNPRTITPAQAASMEFDIAMKSEFRGYSPNMMGKWWYIDDGNNGFEEIADCWLAYYGTIKNNNTSPYNGLDILKYRPASKIYNGEATNNQGQPVNNNKAIATYGDCFISRFDYSNTSYHLKNPGAEPYMDPTYYNDVTVVREKSILSSEIIFFVESPLNVNLASNNTKDSASYSPYYTRSTGGDILNFLDRYHNGPTQSDTEGRLWQEIHYMYNNDFSKRNTENSYIPMPHTYNFCSKCLNKNRNRFYYSEKSFVEELTDFYRIYLVNNYKDIPAETGQIVNITDYKKSILIDTEESRWVQKYSEQQIQTNEASITIGTGEFVATEPDRLYVTDIGYFGNQSRFATVTTEYGVFSVDYRNGMVYSMQDVTPTPISSIGMSSWFAENSKLKLKAQIEQILDLEIDALDWDMPCNVYNPNGYIAAYDSRYKRIILTKHDWLLTEEGLSQYSSGAITLIDNQWNRFFAFDNNGQPIYLKIEPKDFSDLFENHSWTMSYSFKDKCWVSWHSYIPTFMYGNKMQFYSSIGSNLYKHNEFASYQTFYETYYPHIIEVCKPTLSPDSQIFEHLQYSSKAEQWDPASKQFIDKRFITFDKAIFYNSFQNSGLINLVTKKESSFWTRQFQNIANEAIIDVNEKVYSINGFKDLVTDYDVPMFTSEWDQVAIEYFIDKVINSNAISSNKNWYEKAVFRDRYLISRLIFSIFANTRITTNIGMFKTTFSIR